MLLRVRLLPDFLARDRNIVDVFFAVWPMPSHRGHSGEVAPGTPLPVFKKNLSALIFLGTLSALPKSFPL